ncbi:MBL fold metallo-hydrolase [Candidatus Parcubacteria bacterium]|nr:MBL fold metallo-hydrolase [Candidatus Parcubacteria bacterium]
MSKPVLTAFGGVGAVTGANFQLEVRGKKYLIDCGILQGVEGSEKINATFDYEPREIHTLFVTHAHADHIGKIPLLIKRGFSGKIFSTEPTKELSHLMLLDSAHLTQVGAEAKGEEPLYTEKEVERAMSLWQTLEYHAKTDFQDFTLELFNSGHILGSAMYKFTFPSGKSIFFTGDLGNAPSLILPDPEKPAGASYILMESVYGDRNHEPVDERDRKFKEVVRETIESKGVLMIPIFSLERTQIILYELNKLFEADLKPVPVFLDSPLAINITKVYEHVGARFFNSSAKDELKHDDIFNFPKLHELVRARDAHEIFEAENPKIILAGSGMSTAGRILNHEARYLPDPNATVLLVGYQAPATLGREIYEGKKKVSIHGQEVDVRARVVSIEGFSGHMDSDHLVDFVSESKNTLDQVFITMGETKTSEFLAERLHEEQKVNAIVPERLKEYELDL